ncbi:MAG: sigma-70 family RNA polymerase sigma factor [Actinomycetota bacterium]|nr:sigma-70 family RNA polymerase sigma factor [Actinomycetota bacterium]
MSAEERALISRASRGDVDAFSRLVSAHSALVRGVTLRMLGAQESQDASQEVWVRVWANMKSFRGESAFSTWLYRVTVNTCLSFRRKESRRRTREVEEELAHLSLSSGGDGDPEEAALDAERREEIQVALGSIRAEHRAAMVMRHMEGLSCAEISEALGVPDGTVKGWASRGRTAMLAALTQNSASTDRIIRPHQTGRKAGDDAGAPGAGRLR